MPETNNAAVGDDGDTQHTAPAVEVNEMLCFIQQKNEMYDRG